MHERGEHEDYFRETPCQNLSNMTEDDFTQLCKKILGITDL